MKTLLLKLPMIIKFLLLLLQFLSCFPQNVSKYYQFLVQSIIESYWPAIKFMQMNYNRIFQIISYVVFNLKLICNFLVDFWNTKFQMVIQTANCQNIAFEIIVVSENCCFFCKFNCILGLRYITHMHTQKRIENQNWTLLLVSVFYFYVFTYLFVYSFLSFCSFTMQLNFYQNFWWLEKASYGKLYIQKYPPLVFD